MKRYFIEWPETLLLRRTFYDHTIYDSYIDSVMERPRKDPYQCCCFAVFDDQTLEKLSEILKDNQFAYAIPITIDSVKCIEEDELC